MQRVFLSLLCLLGISTPGWAAEPSGQNPGPLPKAAPALESASQDLAAGRYEAAADGFEAVARDAGAPNFVRALARRGLAEAAQARGQAAAALEAWQQLATNATVPAPYSIEARRHLAEAARTNAGKPGRDPAMYRATLPTLREPAVRFSVAADGNDDSDGSTAHPFRSLTRARDAVRSWRTALGGASATGGAVVEVRGGTYPMRATLTLTAEDSGTAEAPVVYRAKAGEQPVFTGGVRIPEWHPLTDVAGRERLAPAARDRVVTADLKGVGLQDWGDPTELRRRPELFVDGVPQTLARWPDEGFVKTGEILGQETFKVWNSISGCKDGKFAYAEDRPTTWTNEPDVRLYGYWFWDWYEEYQRVAAIDPAARSFTLTQPYSQYGYRKDQRYYALNVLRELDHPGEWYLDRRDGRIYWYPPANVDPAKAATVLSVLDRPFLELRETAHVRLLGLTFQEARGDGLSVQGGADNLIAGCVLRRLGGDGVVIHGGQRHGVFGCRLDTLGCGGVRLAGGDRKSLTPGGHFVENCTIADISRLKRTYTPAVHVDGCGQRIAHNLFERMPSSALRVEGNDHLVELNLIRHVVEESDDQGGIDMFGNPLYRGVVIRWNRWSDIGGGTHNGAAGVRLDDMISGVAVQGNIFERCGAVIFGGVQIHGGKDNWVDGNVFLEGFAGISFTRWGPKRWFEAIQPFLPQSTDPAHVSRYPELSRLKDDADVNVVTRNVFVRCGQVFLRDGGIEQAALNSVRSDNLDVEKLASAESILADARLREILFDPIPLAEIGPYEHPWRAPGAGPVPPRTSR